MIKIPSYDRYHRQMILKDFGLQAQQKLHDAKVLVIGAGGLGCPALLYLTGAGIGTVGLLDDDTVSLENLHRQTLYTTADIGFLKAIIASEKLKSLNPDISIIHYALRLTPEVCINIFPSFDIILDCTDNFATRYMINDASVLLGKPLISGAVSQYEGQVAIFNCCTDDKIEAVNYRDLFPEPPKSGEVLNCSEAGVMGALPGIIGSIQAGETIKLLTGIGSALINKLFTYNILNNQTYELILSKNNTAVSMAPETIESFLQTDYAWLCENPSKTFEIDVDFFDQMMEAGNAVIVDVREQDEYPPVTEFPHMKVPFSQFEKSFKPVTAETIIFFCQAGSRSLQAAAWLSSERSIVKNIYSLKGGIINWKKNSKRFSYD
ncbi:MAG: ThiF family adenylyltransferase [Chitinophagaceae bacterium]